MKKVNHDSFIKKAMENPVTARQLLDEYLPNEFKEFIDLTSLKIEKESFIEDDLKTKFSDIIYSAKTNDKTKQKQQNTFIYCLIEHQSYSDYWIALRLWKYSLLLLERHAKKKDKLPLILPLVLYNGKDRYTAPKNIWQLFTNPDLAQNALSEDYNLIDLQAMDDDIDYEKHLSFLLYTMKHIHDRDTLKMLEQAMYKCTKAIVIDKGQDYLHTKLIFWYSNSKVPEKNKHLLEQLIVDNLPNEDKGKIMRTVADSYIDQGFNEGIAIGKNEGIAIGEAKGIEKTALNMLRQNLDLKRVFCINCVNCIISNLNIELNSIIKFYQKVSHSFIPILNRHSPFSSNIINCQVQSLKN